jgi:response regulator of citrate/malate metabolism
VNHDFLTIVERFVSNNPNVCGINALRDAITAEKHRRSTMTLTLQGTYNLSPKQTVTLNMVLHYLRTNDCAPTLRELAKMCGCARETVYEHLCFLKAKGVLSWEKYRARSIRVNIAY